MAPATDWFVGQVGHGLDFDGSDDRVNCGNNTLFNFSGPFSFVVLFEHTEVNTFVGLLSKADAVDWGNNAGWHCGIGDAGEWWMTLGDGAARKKIATTAWGSMSGELWSYAGVWDGPGHSGRLYRDGVEAPTYSYQETSANLTAGAADLIIGGYYDLAPRRCIAAKIYAVLLYPRVLAPAELQHLYRDPFAPLRLRQRRWRDPDRIWGGGTGPVDGLFATGINWSGDTAPGGDDEVTFDATDVTDCDVNADASGTAALATLEAAAGYTGHLDGSLHDKDVTVLGAMTLDCTEWSVGGGEWRVGGDFDCADVGTVNPNRGTVTFDGAGNQSVDLGALTLPNLRSEKSGGVLTFVDGWTATSFVATIGGTINFNQQTVETTGPLSITPPVQVSGGGDLDSVSITCGGLLTLKGAAGALLDLDATGTWTLDANGRTDVAYVSVSECDASGGNTIYARNSDNN